MVAQLCGNDTAGMIAAARVLAQHEVHAIDINLGCPQACAQHGNYGAFLLDRDQWPRVEHMVRGLVAAMAQEGERGLPVFCKMRLLPTIEETVEFAQRLEAAGCSLLTVHGRTREQPLTLTLGTWPHSGAERPRAGGVDTDQNGAPHPTLPRSAAPDYPN